jgi:hypothetical protein
MTSDICRQEKLTGSLRPVLGPRNMRTPSSPMGQQTFFRLVARMRDVYRCLC